MAKRGADEVSSVSPADRLWEFLKKGLKPKEP